MWDGLRFDARQSVRGLLRSPGFTCTVVVTLALTLSAATTMGSLLNAIVLRTVSAREPTRLISISATDSRTNLPAPLYADAFATYHDAQQSLSALSLYSTGLLRLEARGLTTDAVFEGVTPEYFEVVGVRTRAGRSFTDADGTHAPLAVISDRCRQRLFGEGADVIGETVRMDGQPVTIVGVTEPGFAGLQFDGGADLFLPLAVAQSLSGANRALHGNDIVGRLKAGVTIVQARAELHARWSAIQSGPPPPALSAGEQQAWRSERLDMESLAAGYSGLRQQYGTSLPVLAALAALLLTVGCINLASLVLARSLARHQQIAVSLALGASPRRIIQRVVLDGVLLALVGLAASLPLAWWTIRVLAATMTIARATPLQPLTPDVRVLTVMTAITLVIGAAVSLLPAWRAIRGPVADGLRPDRAIAGTLGRSGRLLLVAQVALTMVMLVAAGLFTSTLSRLRANDVALLRPRILWSRLARTPGDRQPIGRAYLQGLVGQLEGIQGVDAAALSLYYPAVLSFPGQLPQDRYARVDGDSAHEIAALTEYVSPGFFNLFGIARLRGRDFSWADEGTTPPVVIVCERVARSLFGDGEAIGRRIHVTSGSTRREFEIVGIVANAAVGKIRDPYQAAVFRPMLQEPRQAQFPLAHVRVTGNIESVANAYARAIADQRHHFVDRVFTAEEWVDHALLGERLMAGLSTFAGAMTLVIACIGIYGALAFAVAARVRDIGVRLALGATRPKVLWTIVSQGLAIALPGILIGVPCAVAVARLLRSRLYEIGPNDPSTIVGACAIIVLTSVIASLVPAWRASNIEPIEALRHE